AARQRHEPLSVPRAQARCAEERVQRVSMAPLRLAEQVVRARVMLPARRHALTRARSEPAHFRERSPPDDVGPRLAERARMLVTKGLRSHWARPSAREHVA